MYVTVIVNILALAGMVAGVLDITTTEWADELVGGVLNAGPERLDAAAKAKVPAIVTPGCLDMVNFGEPATVPAKFAGRTFYHHNPQVTLMRTTAEESEAIGRWIGTRLDAFKLSLSATLAEDRAQAHRIGLIGHRVQGRGEGCRRGLKHLEHLIRLDSQSLGNLAHRRGALQGVGQVLARSEHRPAQFLVDHRLDLQVRQGQPGVGCLDLGVVPVLDGTLAEYKPLLEEIKNLGGASAE